jgi:hypothetical protein
MVLLASMGRWGRVSSASALLAAGVAYSGLAHAQVVQSCGPDAFIDVRTAPASERILPWAPAPPA